MAGGGTSGRADEKQRSRDEDARRVRSGVINSSELRRENNFFASLDMGKFRIVAIGRRVLGGGQTS